MVYYASGSKFDVPEKARSCLDLTYCNKYRHACKFQGRRLFELFKVQIIKLKNDGSGDSGSSGDGSLESPLCGAIDFETHFYPEIISYYADKISLKLEPGKIFNLPISGPKPGCTPKTDYSRWVKLAFNFTFNDHALHDLEVLDPEHMQWYRDCDYSPVIERKLLGNPSKDPFIMAATFGAYEGALATVSVKILKASVTSCSGFVFARPCIFYSRIRLLSLKKDETRELELELDGSGCRCVNLTRSIVTVPSYSSLIIAAVLYDQDGKQIGRDRTSFRAKSEGTYSNVIGNDNIHIGVNWEYDDDD